MNIDIKRQNCKNERAIERLKFNHLKKIDELKGIHKEGNFLLLINHQFTNFFFFLKYFLTL